MEKLISVICPTFNERKNIESIIDFFQKALPPEKELFIIDGGSTDGTLEKITELQKDFDNIFLIKNPDRYVPYALNLGIKNSKGSPIIRIDAHTKYSNDYFEKILETFEETGADIVGGPYRVAFDSNFQEAVGIAISNPFGIGNSKVHNINFSGYVDSVAYGAWKRELFDEVGYFDEKLLRNQDDEFHYRAKSKNKKIYQDSEIKLWYYPRNSFTGLIKQYFQYGLFKPMVLYKVRSEMKIRHLVPSIFFLYLMLLPLYFIYPYMLIPLMFYIMLDIYFSFNLSKKYLIKIYLLFVYPAIHLSYGFGFIIGLFKLLNKK